jgi:hypothetical protein
MVQFHQHDKLRLRVYWVLFIIVAGDPHGVTFTLVAVSYPHGELVMIHITQLIMQISATHSHSAPHDVQGAYLQRPTFAFSARERVSAAASLISFPWSKQEIKEPRLSIHGIEHKLYSTRQHDKEIIPTQRHDSIQPSSSRHE